ncbi:MAG: hypothetical protein OEV60_01385 [Actinomycetota bacterium]|nr:hypothetical protein [Actinomycetota bacterium]MDH5223164.1 hypothetical protein [Actinomycetota bacterium]MDH5312216.1 hypothetical protein [Actinomycetota bacterium]
MTGWQPDRVVLVTAAMKALLADDARPAAGDPDAVGTAHLVCARPGRIAGCSLAKEVFGRLGVRYRPIVVDGDTAMPGDAVAELGGPLAAIGAAAPTAIRLLERLSAVATGTLEPVDGDVIEAHAVSFRLSGRDPVGDDGPSFRLES